MVQSLFIVIYWHFECFSIRTCVRTDLVIGQSSWLWKVRGTLGLMKRFGSQWKEFLLFADTRMIHSASPLGNFWAVFVNCWVQSIPSMSLLRLSRSLTNSISTNHILHRWFHYLSPRTNSLLSVIIVRLQLYLAYSLLIKKTNSVHRVSSCCFPLLLRNCICKPTCPFELLFIGLFHGFALVAASIITLLRILFSCLCSFIFFIVLINLLTFWHLSGSLHPLVLTDSELLNMLLKFLMFIHVV